MDGLMILVAVANIGLFLLALAGFIYSRIDRAEAKETVRLANEALAKAEESLRSANAAREKSLFNERNTAFLHHLEAVGMNAILGDILLILDDLQELGSPTAEKRKAHILTQREQIRKITVQNKEVLKERFDLGWAFDAADSAVKKSKGS